MSLRTENSQPQYTSSTLYNNHLKHPINAHAYTNSDFDKIPSREEIL